MGLAWSFGRLQGSLRQTGSFTTGIIHGVSRDFLRPSSTSLESASQSSMPVHCATARDSNIAWHCGDGAVDTLHLGSRDEEHTYVNTAAESWERFAVDSAAFSDSWADRFFLCPCRFSWTPNEHVVCRRGPNFDCCVEAAVRWESCSTTPQTVHEADRVDERHGLFFSRTSEVSQWTLHTDTWMNTYGTRCGYDRYTVGSTSVAVVLRLYEFPPPTMKSVWKVASDTWSRHHANIGS